MLERKPCCVVRMCACTQGCFSWCSAARCGAVRHGPILSIRVRSFARVLARAARLGSGALLVWCAPSPLQVGMLTPAPPRLSAATSPVKILQGGRCCTIGVVGGVPPLRFG